MHIWLLAAPGPAGGLPSPKPPVPTLPPNPGYANGCSIHQGVIDRQTDRQAGGRLGSRALAVKFKALPFRNKGLNQHSVETLYAGNVGHHYTKISEK